MYAPYGIILVISFICYNTLSLNFKLPFTPSAYLRVYLIHGILAFDNNLNKMYDIVGLPFVRSGSPT